MSMPEYSIPPKFQSDGCTMSGALKKLLGGNRYIMFCREHDFLRRHKVVHPIKANAILARRIASEHFIGFLRAPLYFIATTVSMPWYNHTRELPEAWYPYARHYDKRWSL